MVNQNSKSWWDLTPEEKLAFAKTIGDKMLGWEGLQRKALASGFEATEDMPTIWELRKMVGETK